MRATRPGVLALSVCLLLGGCGGGEVASPAATNPSTSETPSPSSTPSGTQTDAPPSDDPEPTALPSSAPLPDDDLAGEPHDGPPVHGMPASLLVVGVAVDDVLNVRRGPGVDEPVVGELAPLARDVTATGRARTLPGAIWLELDLDGTIGWANARYLAHPGATGDVTAEFLAEHGRLTAPDITSLGLEVGRLRASTDPPSDVVVVDGPGSGDLAEITIDVVGLGDDAQRAERLVVFAVDDEDGGVELRTIEATQICGRQAGGEGGCP